MNEPDLTWVETLTPAELAELIDLATALRRDALVLLARLADERAT